MTAWTHGPDQVVRVEKAAGVLFGDSLSDASPDDILMVFDDVPSVSVSAAALTRGLPVTELAVTAGLAASKGEAVRLIRQGGLYINDKRVGDERAVIGASDAIGGTVVVLRKGQRERRLARIVQGAEQGEPRVPGLTPASDAVGYCKHLSLAVPL